MISPADNLPPVQPPSARFLMQLFVVPLVIVAAIILVCLMFNWLAHLGTEPRDLVNDLAKLNAGSWQKALTVANLLTDRRHASLRQDPALARQLSTLLADQLGGGEMSPEAIKLRIYLCSALGVLEVDEGLDTLILAATLQRDPSEIEVRKAAIEALASRAAQSIERREALQQHRQLLAALQQAAAEHTDDPDRRDSAAQLRLRAAYALGVIGGSDARDTLAGMLSDVEVAVRFNAATGLARHGDERAVARLIEMLETRTDTGLQPLDEFATTTVLQNALRATIQLVAANPGLPRDGLRQAIEQLADDARVSPVVRRGIELDTRLALQQLQQPATP